MFARTVWSDDVLAETITDLIYHFNLTSLKTMGTEGNGNHVSLAARIKEMQEPWRNKTVQSLISSDSFSLCSSMIEYNIEILTENRIAKHILLFARFPDLDKTNSSHDQQRFEDAAEHVMDSFVDAFVVSIKADTKK